MIPKRLHLVWYQGWDRLPSRYQDSLSRWHRLHPEWDVRLWDQPKMEGLLRRMPKWAPLYYSCYYMISRCDVGRLAILDLLGGVYADVDTVCFQPLDGLLEEVERQGCTGFLAQGTVPVLSLLPGHRQLLQRLRIPSVSNCGMGFEAGHPYLAHLRSQMQKNTASWVADVLHPVKGLEVVWTTGPIALSMALKAHPQGVHILPLELWQSRRTVGGPSSQDYLHQVSTTGAYAAHWGEGSWEQSRHWLWMVLLLVAVVILIILRRAFRRRRA